MSDELKDLIYDHLASCITTEDLCNAYAEIYAYTKEQMKEFANSIDEVKNNESNN